MNNIIHAWSQKNTPLKNGLTLCGRNGLLGGENRPVNCPLCSALQIIGNMGKTGACMKTLLSALSALTDDGQMVEMELGKLVQRGEVVNRVERGQVILYLPENAPA